MAKNCAICGKPSGMYPLCSACFKLRDAGKIEKCEKCGIWHYTDKPCQCISETKAETKPTPEKQIAEKAEPKAQQKCILCEKDSEQFFFCKECYHKYKKKNLLLKVTDGCTKIEILDESYEGIYTCDDGHIVKSMAEKSIDDYLFHKKIPHAYEKAVSIDANPDHDLHPDFYLIDEDIYLEHWGYGEENLKYQEQKKYKIEKYQELGITVISTTPQDLSNLSANLERKLKYCKKGSVNE